MKGPRRTSAVWGLVLAPLALGLGYAGYRSLSSPAMNPIDALFRSLQLFALEGGVTSQATPWALNVARFMAPLAVAYATVVALMTILRDQVQCALAAALARDHVVLIGLARSSDEVAASLRRSGHRTVLVEANGKHERIPGIRATGTLVIIGDPAQPPILRRARIASARHVIIATGDDSANLEIAEQVRRTAVQEGKNRRTTVHLSIADPILWVEFGRLSLAQVPAGVCFEVYNVVDRAAQRLLDEAERQCAHDIYQTIVLDGDGLLAQRTIVHLVRRAALSGKRPVIYADDLTSTQVVFPLLRQEAWLEQCASFITRASPQSLAEGPSVALVCRSGSDAEAIARALTLSRPVGRHSVYVSVRGEQPQSLLESLGVRVHTVLTSQAAVELELLHQLATRRTLTRNAPGVSLRSATHRSCHGKSSQRA
jgi:TrkA-N domain